MIIDCHGHYTTAPQAHTDWRDGSACRLQGWRVGAALPGDLRRRDQDVDR